MYIIYFDYLKYFQSTCSWYTTRRVCSVILKSTLCCMDRSSNVLQELPPYKDIYWLRIIIKINLTLFLRLPYNGNIISAKMRHIHILTDSIAVIRSKDNAYNTWKILQESRNSLEEIYLYGFLEMGTLMEISELTHFLSVIFWRRGLRWNIFEQHILKRFVFFKGDFIKTTSEECYNKCKISQTSTVAEA